MYFKIEDDSNLFKAKKVAKEKYIKTSLTKILRFHMSKSKKLKKYIEILFLKISANNSIIHFPFIPVRLFKENDLISIPEEKIFKVLSSSGTTGNVSKIFLDKENSKNQIKVLSQIFQNFIGKDRLPMLVIDSNSLINSINYSARKAAIQGFSIFAKNITYALDNDLNIKHNEIINFIKKNENERFLVFGFTFIIWEKFLNALKKQKLKINMSKGILLHGGGWKKLTDLKINNDKFKKNIMIFSKINKIINYYGMIEQTGSIFFECEYSYYHTSIYTDIIIRDEYFNSCSVGEKGLIQCISLIPTSYPGNSILTEDIGFIVGEDDCKCGRMGKYFKVEGRVKDAELRGCGDINR